MAKRVVRIGLDFDGVVAYNPFRIIRAPIKWFKREVLGINRLSFFVPKNAWQKIMWVVVHESSVFPSQGVEMLKNRVDGLKVEFHLITGRYGFLEHNLRTWLTRNKLEKCFKSININEHGEQPHVFKEQMVGKLGLDVYIEDNLDIVMYLQKLKRCRVMWVYNMLDRNKNYTDKYPHLKAALTALGL